MCTFYLEEFQVVEFCSGLWYQKRSEKNVVKCVIKI